MKSIIRLVLCICACCICACCIFALSSFEIQAQKRPTIKRQQSTTKPATKPTTKSNPTTTKKAKSTITKNKTKSKGKVTQRQKSKTQSNQPTYQAPETNPNPIIETLLEISTNNVHFDATGGDEYFTITCNKEWYISMNTRSWGILTRNGNQLSLSVSNNQGTEARTDYFCITADDKTITVNITQDGFTPSLSVTNEYIYMNYDGGSQYRTVFSNAEWWIQSKPYWANASKDDDKLVVTVDRNDYSTTRYGDIIIKCGNLEKTIKLAQYGSPPISSTSSSTQSTTTNNTYGYNDTYEHYSQVKRDSWWKGRISFGIELVGDVNADFKKFDEEIYYRYGAGARLRFGRYTDFLNLTIGAKWTKCGYHSKELTMEADYMAFPANLKFNLFHLAKQSKFYIGGGYEYYLPLGYATAYMDWNAGIGVNARHIDWYIYGKQLFERKNNFPIFLSEEWRFGTSLTIYF